MKELEKQTKREFIKEYLQPLLKKINESIYKVEYAITEYNEEYVIIRYENTYIKKICVTADSLKAIVIDVMRNSI